jgi:hypothetical protein
MRSKLCKHCLADCAMISLSLSLCLPTNLLQFYSRFTGTPSTSYTIPFPITIPISMTTSVLVDSSLWPPYLVFETSHPPSLLYITVFISCGGILVSMMRINVDSDLVASSRLSKARASIKGHFTPASSSSSTGSISSSCDDGDDTETVFADLCSSQTAQVDGVIKSAIWVFRSSINTHRLWPPSLLLHSPTSPGLECRRRLDYDLPIPSQASAGAASHAVSQAAEQAPPVVSKEQLEILKKKGELAPYWNVICPTVKACCETRTRELEWRLAQYYKLHSLSLNSN